MMQRRSLKHCLNIGRSPALSDLALKTRPLFPSGRKPHLKIFSPGFSSKKKRTGDKSPGRISPSLNSSKPGKPSRSFFPRRLM